MALPPTHFLIGAACGELTRCTPVPAWKAWLVGGLVAIAPDLASALALVLGHGAPLHGLYSHTLLATALVGLLGWFVGGRQWGVLVAASYGSHLLVDLLRRTESTNVYLLGPFIDVPSEPLFRLFPHIPFDFHQDGVLITLYGSRPWNALLRQTIMGVVILLGAIGVRRAILCGRPHPKDPSTQTDMPGRITKRGG